MLYGRVATGYRPGGPNVIVPNVPPSVDADRMTNYEIGLKADLADRMASVDVALFWMDWTDIQVTRAFGGVSGGANGGKATSKGIEGSLALRSEEHTSELQSLMRISYAVFCLKKKKK